MDYGRITIRNILIALLLGSIAAIWGLHDAKKETKEDKIATGSTIVIPPE